MSSKSKFLDNIIDKYEKQPDNKKEEEEDEEDFSLDEELMKEHISTDKKKEEKSLCEESIINVDKTPIKVYGAMDFLNTVDTLYLTNKVYIYSKTLTEISGEAGSGKTNLALFLALLTSLPKSLGGKNKSTIYISTTMGKPLTEKIAKLKENYMQKIQNEDEKESFKYKIKEKRIYSSDDFTSYINTQLVTDIPRYDVQTIVVDSFTEHADSFVKSDENGDESYEEKDYAKRSNFIVECIEQFEHLKLKYNLFIFCINNVRNVAMDEKSKVHKKINGSITPCLGKVWENNLDNRFYLKKLSIKNDYGQPKRRIEIKRSNSTLENDVGFSINDYGVVFE